MRVNFKENKGITLIVLVVTIIVLLILAGISVSMLTGQNGILNRASEAKEKTTKAQEEEKTQLKGISVILNGLKVGSTVKYTPKGKYEWKSDYSGYESDIELNSEENNFMITTWKVLSIENTKVILIADKTTTGMVPLSGAQGYNNGVKLLNEACNNLYGNYEKGIKGRSINIQDIEKYMLSEKLAEAHSFKEYVKYGEQVEKSYTLNVKYPAIYAKEKLSVINGVKNESGIEKSEQFDFIEKNDIANLNDGLISATSIQPFQEFWRKDNNFLKNAFEREKTDYYNLLIKPTNSYWLSTRSINMAQNIFSFDIRKMYYGEAAATSMFSNIGSNSSNDSILPIITLNLENIYGNETNGFAIK